MAVKCCGGKFIISGLVRCCGNRFVIYGAALLLLMGDFMVWAII